jgi:uncharacterized UPF0160 family protein
MDEGELLNVQCSILRPQVSGRSQSRCRVGRHWQHAILVVGRQCVWQSNVLEWVAELNKPYTYVCVRTASGYAVLSLCS